MIARGRSARGHIFNLGHGVLPTTDPDVLTRLVEFVHHEAVSARVLRRPFRAWRDAAANHERDDAEQSEHDEERQQRAEGGGDARSRLR